MLAGKTEVQNMIPQKSPMAMVDGLITSNKNTTVSQLVIDKQNIFCKDGFFREPGLIENIAQSAALRAGYEAKQKNEAASLGYIGSVKKLKIYELPKDTDTLQTKITIQHELLNASVIKGEIFVDDKKITEGEMTIFKQN
ncbi:MAG: 3-hydroxyacyl-ACP dehydratase [Bacteroidetes bacterium]|nr:MAG: 3-hydroxyacyl-ACP dehydratase [Bacteroidota bacterium]